MSTYDFLEMADKWARAYQRGRFGFADTILRRIMRGTPKHLLAGRNQVLLGFLLEPEYDPAH